MISGADEINVRLLDNKTLPAKVVGADPKTDIAVLKIKASGLTPIQIGDSDKLRVGEMVLAIGSPLSPSLAHTVTSGIVSATGRSNVGLADYEDFIQTDAAINPGNSGGALINVDGQLVGINTAIASQSGGYQGIGFAVPSNMAKQVMESLIKTGKVVRGWLGVYVQNIDDALASAMKLKSNEGALVGADIGFGGEKITISFYSDERVDFRALVADLAKDGPAVKAGVEQGDIIVGLDGKKIKDSTELRNDIAARKPGSKVTLDMLRDGKKKDITVKLETLPTDQVAKDVGDQLEKQFGFTVAPLTSDLASKYQLDSSLGGVVITSVDMGGPAQQAGLREGDLIVEINRSPTKDIEHFNEQVRDLKKGDTVLLRVVRGNRSFYVGFQL